MSAQRQTPNIFSTKWKLTNINLTLWRGLHTLLNQLVCKNSSGALYKC
jgi:hypothetical protein